MGNPWIKETGSNGRKEKEGWVHEITSEIIRSRSQRKGRKKS